MSESKVSGGRSISDSRCAGDVIIAGAASAVRESMDLGLSSAVIGC